MRVEVLAAVAIGISLFSGCKASGEEPRPVEPPPPVVPHAVVGSLIDLCRGVDLRPSPDGAFLAVQARSLDRVPRRIMSSGDVSLVALPCLFDPNARNCDVHRIRSVAGVSEPQWSENGAELTLLGNSPRGVPGWIFGFRLTRDAGGASVWARQAAAPFRARPYDLIRTGANSQSVAEQAQAYDAVISALNERATLPIGGYWAGSEYIGYLSEDRDTGGLRYTPPSGDLQPIPTTAALLPDAAPALNETGQAELLGMGYRSSLTGASPPLRAPFHRTVHDARTGRAVGSYGPETLDLPPRFETAGRALEAALKGYGDARFIAVTTLDAGSAVFALARRTNGDLMVLHITGDSVQPDRRDIGCASGQPSRDPVSLTQQDWGRDGRLLPVSLYETAGADTLVVFLHGGPGRNEVGGETPPPVQMYLDRGYSVAVPEYSGSSGGGLDLAGRIATSGAAAHRLDAADLSLALRDRRAKYDRIGLHAESFGGALITQPDLRNVDFVVAIAPYVRHRDPASWRTRDLSPNRIAYQNAGEAAFFGAPGSAERTGFESALIENLANWAPTAPTLIIIGSRDDFSQPSDFEAVARNPRVRLHVVDQANHLTIFSEREGETLRSFLNSVGSR